MTTPALTPPNELDLLRNALPEALARDDFANLAVLLRYATDGCFAIAVYNSAPAREQVVNALRQLVAPLPVFEWTYSPLDPYPFSYLDRLTDAQRRERAVVFFFGLDKADADVWKSLDYRREQLSGRPHGLVFWLTPKALGEVARGAPHFWSQRSGVFDFTIAQPDLAQQMRDAAWQAAPEAPAWAIDREDKERELRLYEELLRDYQADPSTPARTLFDLHSRLSKLLYYSDRVSESRQHAMAALELCDQLDRPGDRADTLKALGDLGLREDDLKGARARYEAALPIYRAIGDRLGEANTLKALGDERLAADDAEAGLQFYRQAQTIYELIADRYSQSRNLIRMAAAHLALGQSGDATPNLVVAARLADEIGDRNLRRTALDLLAQIGEAAGDWQALSDALDAMTTARPHDPELRMRRGDVRHSQKRYDDALADYQAAVNLAPQDAWAWNGLGNALESLKRTDEAIAAYSRAIEIEPDTAPFYRNRANALLDLGRTDEAEADVAQAVKLDPDHPYTRGRQGCLALARGQFAEALSHFEAAAEADESWRYGLALAQFGHGETDRARITLSAARPDMGDDEVADALSWLERIVRLKPDLAAAAEDLRALLR
jgi:tetratricopeptide (TPR) repeat protein